jgi:hypothetical protein
MMTSRRCACPAAGVKRTRPLFDGSEQMYEHYDGILKLDGEVGDKIYDPAPFGSS